jgi:hypothetical protein
MLDRSTMLDDDLLLIDKRRICIPIMDGRSLEIIRGEKGE